MTTSKKKILPFLFFLLLGISLVIFGINKWLNDVNIDLSKADRVSGIVEHRSVQYVKGPGTPGKYSQPAFMLKIMGNKDVFGVYRSHEDYQDLMTSIQEGDSVTVYHRPASTRYNFYVFQITKNGKVVKGYQEYNQSVSAAGGISLFLGILISIGAILWYRKFDMIRFLNRLVGR